MKIKNLLKYGLALTAAVLTMPAEAQDLMARQAPIDTRLRAVDSIALHRLLKSEAAEGALMDPADDIYDSWSNEFVTYNDTPLPAEYKIDLRNFHMPCDSRVVNSHYGYRRQFRRNHYGTDIKAYMGDTIRAAFDGKVRIVKDQGYRRGYGRYVVLRHPNGLETIYGHLSAWLVTEDQPVKAGDPIGLAGSTGRSTGPHLHFETRLLGEKIDPEKLFCFEAGDVRGDFYVWRRNGRSQLMAAHDVSNLPEVSAEEQEAKAEESRQFQQQKMAERGVKRHAKGRNSAKVYKVRKGDTLSSIARRHGTTIDRLCKLNHISRTSTLRLGQIIKCS
ncbi:MAG: peptidoglycan DD-metalloendopeptidase family protein [Bacteroidaceae bacterium]|nr:peptidoglycan DD-metalloendopeptidase family protein [Bacteroidaceae bacterium]